MNTRLAESATLAKTGANYSIRLLSEGVGSSGTYPGDVLQRDGAVAWPSGTQIFLDHLTESDNWERNGNHSIRDLVGVTTSDPVYDPTTKALNASAKFFESAAPFIADAMEYVGLSVEASGTIVEGIVEAIHPSPLNAIAVVPRAGRDGKITALIEAYRENHDKIITEGVNAPDEEGKDKGMTPEDIQKIAEAFAKAIQPSFDAIQESLKPAVVDPTEDAAIDVATVAEAMIAAGLPESARTRVYEAHKNDAKADVAALIESEKAYVTAIRESLAAESGDESPGKISESAGTDGSNPFAIGAWS